jgi:hypothetical protein
MNLLALGNNVRTSERVRGPNVFAKMTRTVDESGYEERLFWYRRQRSPHACQFTSLAGCIEAPERSATGPGSSSPNAGMTLEFTKIGRGARPRQVGSILCCSAIYAIQALEHLGCYVLARN